MRCGWCLEDHALEQCPKLGSFVMRTPEPEPSTADDINDALAQRAMGWRMVVGQLLREMAQGRRSPSPETLSLYPEPFDP